MKLLQRPFSGRQADLRPRIEVLDRLALGGKKSLLLIAIEGRRLLVGVGEDAAPSISGLNEVRRAGLSGISSVNARRPRGKRIVRA
jgi:flagellar biogenesis protein FliO